MKLNHTSGNTRTKYKHQSVFCLFFKTVLCLLAGGAVASDLLLADALGARMTRSGNSRLGSSTASPRKLVISLFTVLPPYPSEPDRYWQKRW